MIMMATVYGGSDNWITDLNRFINIYIYKSFLQTAAFDFDPYQADMC